LKTTELDYNRRRRNPDVNKVMQTANTLTLYNFNTISNAIFMLEVHKFS